MLFFHGGFVRPALLTLACLAMLVLLAGCQAREPAASLTPQELAPLGLSDASYFEPVDARVVPPVDWRIEPLKSSNRHKHQVWLSPSGNTAYGVIRFRLPVPLSPESVLHLGVLPEMKRTEGEANLVSSKRDPDLPGVRFVAAGGKYLVRGNLLTDGWRGWMIYAGTLRAQPINPSELEIAELAREHTLVDKAR
jgi:hypothetical protein